MTLLLAVVAYGLALSAALARAGHRDRQVGAASDLSEKPISRVLVVGATGGTGRELVAQALERGLHVTALARTPEKLTVEHARLIVHRGDVLDAASVEAAMRGQDAVLCALGHKRYFQPTRILSTGTRNLLRSMAAQDVRRIVCETSLGIGDSAFRMGVYYTLFTIPFILPFYFWDKTRQERALAESGSEWTIVRPGALTHGARTGRLRHGQGIGSLVLTRSVSRADVATFMLDQLTSRTYLRRAPGVVRGAS